MPREDNEGRRTEFPLAPRDEASAVQVAEALCATWRAIEAALAPVLGSGGVAALYQRSLHLTSEQHAWFVGLHESVQGTLDLAALKSAMAQQTTADAAAGGNALLQNFYQLLASLIGPSLTERLLRSVWADSSSGASAQDTSS